MISEDSSNPVNQTVYTFTEFTLEAENLLLLKNSEVVPLAPKAVEVLLALIESDGKLLTKQQILDKVWANSFVEEANLTHHISAIRRALGEDKDSRKFIETIPRRGYRFIAEVKKSAVEPDTITITSRTTLRVAQNLEIETDGSDMVVVAAENNLRLSEAPNIVRRNNPYLLGGAAMIVGLLLIGTTSFWVWRGWHSQKRVVSIEKLAKRLTPDTDSDAPAISPDGKSVAFVRFENAKRTLWRKEIATGEMTQLSVTTPFEQTGGFFTVRFSPDGKWIYYLAPHPVNSATALYRIPAGGGTARMVFENVKSDFSFAPDSRQISFADELQLIVGDAETGEQRVVAQHTQPGRKFIIHPSETSPAWSPDGQRIVIPGKQVNPDGSVEKQLIEVDTVTGAQKLLPIAKDFEIKQIEWLPDNSGFVVTKVGNSLLPAGIWTISYPDGATRQITPPDVSVKDIRLSADGKKLVFGQVLSHFNLWLAPIENLEQRRQISVGAAAYHGTQGLAYLPDGKILYTSTQSGSFDLWKTDETGENLQQVTVNSGYYNGLPQVTRDGRFVVFISDRTGTPQIWRIDAESGRNPLQLTQSLTRINFELSPDNWIYLEENVPGSKRGRIFRISVENGERNEVDNNIYKDFPGISPDGKWMLADAAESNKMNLIDASTGKAVRDISRGYGNPGWWLDSSAIVNRDKSGKKFVRVPIDGSEPQTIADYTPYSIGWFDFSPNGKNIVFSLGYRTREVFLIENFNGVGN